MGTFRSFKNPTQPGDTPIFYIDADTRTQPYVSRYRCNGCGEFVDDGVAAEENVDNAGMIIGLTMREAFGNGSVVHQCGEVRGNG